MGICIDCGKPIPGAATRLRCEECNHRHQLEYYAQRRAEARERAREGRAKDPPVVKYCMDCGVQLPLGCCSRQKRCEICGKVRKKEMARLRVARRKAEEEKKAKKKASLGAVAREAAAHGMSYGQWVAANGNGG